MSLTAVCCRVVEAVGIWMSNMGYSGLREMSESMGGVIWSCWLLRGGNCREGKR